MGQILTVVGYAVGTYFGYPQLGALIGGALGAATTKTPGVQGPRLGDLRVQGTEYGQTIPWVASSPRLAGQIAWASNRREIATREKVGKGGGQKVTTFTYEVDLLILITENPIAGVLRVFSNGELVYSITPTGETTKDGVWNGIAFYDGTADQMPDPTYEAAVGAGNAPAYRGRGYVVINGLQLGNSGQIPNITFEVATLGEDGSLPEVADLSLSRRAVVDANGDANFTVESSPAVFGKSLRVGAVGQPAIVVGSASDALLATGDFDIQCRIYRDQVFPPAEIQTILSTEGLSGNAGGWSIQLAATNPPYVAFYMLVGNARYFTLNATSHTNPFQEWQHVRAQRVSDTVYLFIDGELAGSVFVGAEALCSPTGQPLSIGRGRADNNGFNGYIDEVVISRAPGSGSIVPSAQHTVTEDTVVYVPFNRVSTFSRGLQPLSVAVDELMLRAGYSHDEYETGDLDAITKPLRGLAIGQITNTRSVFETLQTAFFFEPAKSDKVYFKPRALTPIADIPFSDLGAAIDAVNDEEPLSLVVGNEMEISAQISLSYANVNADYNVGTEHSDRLLSGQETNQAIQLGLGMLPAEAKGVVDALLFDQIAGLTRTTIRLPLKYARIEPGDVFTVTNQDGRQYRLRSQTKRDNIMVIEHECALDDAGALTSSQITSDDYALTEDVRRTAPTIWEPMDIPILRDGDNQAGFYLALTPDRQAPEDDWPGAVAVRSWSADAFEQLFTSGDACVMGICTTTLGDFLGGSGRFDEGHTLIVRVTGELASSTRADMLDDLSINAALVGSEILRFRLAELLGTVDGENEYRLSGFVRGQRGTEQHIGTHGAGERFVLLNASLRRVLNQNSEIDVSSDIKAVTLNTLLSAVTAEAFTDTGVSLKPFSVAGLRALADGDDIVLTWNRRTRLSYRYGGTVGASVPLGEATEAYRIDVYDGATLVNTYTATDGTYTYAAADIAADGFTTGDPITFVVRQLSEIVGPGFPATIERDAP